MEVRKGSGNSEPLLAPSGAKEPNSTEANATLPGLCSTSCATAIDKRRIPSRIMSGVALEKFSLSAANC